MRTGGAVGAEEDDGEKTPVRRRLASRHAVAGSAALYALCSSSLSVVNKWAILAVPFPGLVTAAQFLATAATVFGLGQLGALEVERLEVGKMVQMAPINVVFYLAIFTNGKVLEYSTVETFIAFRSLTPLLVSGLDTVLRGEPRPSARTLATLLVIAAGALSYARHDVNFSPLGYGWALVYLVVIVAEMVYAKHITSTVDLSTWGLVLYQNTIALALFPIASTLSGEFGSFAHWTRVGDHRGDVVASLLPVLTSCLLGVGISFAGWGTRSNVSATQFTVLGVACKLATVAINVTIWDHHASLGSQLSIVACILASVAYQKSADLDKVERRKAQARAPPSRIPL